VHKNLFDFKWAAEIWLERKDRPEAGTDMRRKKMIRRLNPWILIAIAAGLAAACAGQTRLLDEKQAMAMQTAVTRGQSDLDCGQLSPTLVSREVGWPSQQGTWVQGIYRAEYTIKVEGCGKSRSYDVICPDGDLRCFAVGPGGLADWQ
jgi:hypothetical protein